MACSSLVLLYRTYLSRYRAPMHFSRRGKRTSRCRPFAGLRTADMRKKQQVYTSDGLQGRAGRMEALKPRHKNFFLTSSPYESNQGTTVYSHRHSPHIVDLKIKQTGSINFLFYFLRLQQGILQYIGCEAREEARGVKKRGWRKHAARHHGVLLRVLGCRNRASHHNCFRMPRKDGLISSNRETCREWTVREERLNLHLIVAGRVAFLSVSTRGGPGRPRSV